eukprot:241693-Rhodomonas_salina.1
MECCEFQTCRWVARKIQRMSAHHVFSATAVCFSLSLRIVSPMTQSWAASVSNWSMFQARSRLVEPAPCIRG